MHTFFTNYSSGEWFHFLAIVNGTAMNITKQVSVKILYGFFQIYVKQWCSLFIRQIYF